MIGMRNAFASDAETGFLMLQIKFNPTSVAGSGLELIKPVLAATAQFSEFGGFAVRQPRQSVA
jgi:hypothetical protein